MGLLACAFGWGMFVRDGDGELPSGRNDYVGYGHDEDGYQRSSDLRICASSSSSLYATTAGLFRNRTAVSAPAHHQAYGLGTVSMVVHVRRLSCALALAATIAPRCLSAAQVKGGDNGYDLYRACQDAVHFTDASSEQPGRADYCFGYFEGYTDVATVNVSSLCIGKATVGTLIRVYLAYMDKNPKMLDSFKMIGVTYALKEAYSCPKTLDSKP